MRLRMLMEQEGGTLAAAKRVETTRRPPDAGRGKSLKHQIERCALGHFGSARNGAASRLTYALTCFAGRTTRLTPSAVSAMPATVTTVIDSPNKAQAIAAVVGGTR